jgi:hypothetical protein
VMAGNKRTPVTIKLGHYKNGKFCHSFSIEESYYQSLLNGGYLMSSKVLLPDDTHPIPFTPIKCGTCGCDIPNSKFITRER